MLAHQFNRLPFTLGQLLAEFGDFFVEEILHARLSEAKVSEVPDKKPPKGLPIVAIGEHHS